MFKTHFSLLLVLSLSAFTRSKDVYKIQEFVNVNCQATGTGTWDLGLGTWDLGPGTWDLGPGTWDLGPRI